MSVVKVFLSIRLNPESVCTKFVCSLWDSITACLMLVQVSFHCIRDIDINVFGAVSWSFVTGHVRSVNEWQQN